MRLSILALATVAALTGTAFAQTNGTTNDTSKLPTIDVASAKIEGDKVTGVKVTIDKPGYLVIHDDAAGKPPASLGHIAVQPGTSVNISVSADKPLDPSHMVSLMLHYETNDNTTYDFAPGSTEVDTPVMGAGNTMVSVPMPM
ncbi:MAG: DUF7282 domain-containing protein [Allorhizobium sp.]